jgi:integrase
MRVHRLTDIAISAIKPPSSGQVVYRDAGSPLQLRVSAGGSKTFYVVVGQGRRHTIGRFGEVTLAHARDVARRIKAEKTLGRYTQNLMPVERARAEYLGHIVVRSNTRAYYERSLNKLTGRLTDIKTGDINRVLDALGTTSRNQALAAFRAFFRWCIRRKACDDSESRAPDDTGSCLIADRIVRSPGAFSTITKLLILTGQRRNEIASLRVEYIKNDVCTFPSALTKNKRDHAIPLGACASSIISSHASKAGLLFPARGLRETPFNGWSKSKTALDRRLGKAVEPWTLHDIRRYYSSTMARLGVRLEVTERLLNHVSGTQSGVAGIYNRHTYLAEMREAVDIYERHIQQLVVG